MVVLIMNYQVCNADIHYQNLTEYYTLYYEINGCAAYNSIFSINDEKPLKN